MGTNKLGSLTYSLGIDSGAMRSDVSKATRHFDTLERKATRSFNNIKTAAYALGGAVAAIGLTRLAQTAIDSADKIGKLSDRLGASTEALSQYQYVAELSGVTFETLTMGWQRMTRRVAEAANGFGEAKGALVELNLSAKDLNQLKPEDQFEVISNALSGLTNSADRVRLAMKLFDSGGVSLLQTMTQGADGIRDMRKEADGLGLTLSREDALGAAAANDAFTKLKASGEALSLSIARTLGPGLADIANWLSNKIPEAVRFAKESYINLQIAGNSIVQSFLEGGSKQAQDVADNAKKNIEVLKNELVNLGKETAFISSSNFNVGGADDGGTGSATREAQAKSLEQLENSLMSEELQLTTSFSNRREIVRNALETEMIDQDRHDAIMLKLKTNFNQKRLSLEKKSWTDRQKFSNKSSKEQSKQVIGDLINLTAGIAQHDRKAFELNKAAGIANAIINTHTGVTKSLSAYPWPLAGIMAATHLAAGAAQISAIKSTSFGSGGGAPSGITGGAGATTADTIESIDTGGKRDTGSQINIYIEGSAIGDEQVRQVIVEAIETAQSNDEIILRTGTGG